MRSRVLATKFHHRCRSPSSGAPPNRIRRLAPRAAVVLSDEPALPLLSEGVQRYVWESAFGPMLIEVRDGAAFVNGQRVLSINELRADGGSARK